MLVDNFPLDLSWVLADKLHKQTNGAGMLTARRIRSKNPQQQVAETKPSVETEEVSPLENISLTS